MLREFLGLISLTNSYRQQLSRIGLLTLSIALLSLSNSRADVIDFETTPAGGAPGDNNALTTSYSVDGVDITFSVDTNGGGSVDPVFEQIGVQSGEAISGSNNGTGFTKNVGAAAIGDEAAAGFESQLGNWFLRFGDGRTRHSLVIDYSSVASPVTGASGEIWDIDGREINPAQGAEQWLVEAFDGSTNLLDSLISPLGLVQSAPNTLDAKPWVFQFSNLTGGDGLGIRQIRLSYVGSVDTDTVGIAFNNFSPTVAIPEPATFSILALVGSCGLFTRRRRNA